MVQQSFKPSGKLSVLGNDSLQLSKDGEWTFNSPPHLYLFSCRSSPLSRLVGEYIEYRDRGAVKLVGGYIEYRDRGAVKLVGEYIEYRDRGAVKLVGGILSIEIEGQLNW